MVSRFVRGAVCVVILSSPAPVVAQTLQQVTNARDRRVEIFADGNVKNVVSEGAEGSATTGSLGLRYIGPTYTVTGIISIAGAADTISKSYGATLLTPATGKALNSGLLDIRRQHLFGMDSGCDTAMAQHRHPIRCNLGLHAYASASSSLWATAFDTNGTITKTTQVPAWGWGVGVFYRFVQGTIGGSEHPKDAKDVAMILDLGLAARSLRGDLYNQPSTRTALLGTDKRNFYGPEVGLGLQYDMIKAGITYYFMDGTVKGLSNGQIVVGVGIQANLNSGVLSE